MSKLNTIAVRLDDDEKRAIDNEARNAKLSTSTFVREVMRAYLKKKKVKYKVEKIKL